MNLPRACYLAAGLSLAILGCKSGPTNLLALRAPSAAQLATHPPSVTESPVAFSTKPVPVAPAAFQEPLPQPSADAPAPTPHEFVGDVLSREWLQAEIEAR